MPFAKLTADEQRQITQQACVQGLGARIAAIDDAGYQYRETWGKKAPATASATAILNAFPLTTAAQPGITGFNQPDVARQLVLVANQAITNNVTLRGTDINGTPISETVALNGTTPVNTVNAYATLTGVDMPVRANSGDTVSIGTTAKLGLARIFYSDTVLFALVDGAKDASYTLTKSTAAVAQNLVQFNTAPNGTRLFRLIAFQERD